MCRECLHKLKVTTITAAMQARICNHRVKTMMWVYLSRSEMHTCCCCCWWFPQQCLWFNLNINAVKLTFVSRLFWKNDLRNSKCDDWGIRITTVYCLLQGKGSILWRANCAVPGISVLLTLERPSSWICNTTWEKIIKHEKWTRLLFYWVQSWRCMMIDRSSLKLSAKKEAPK